jgi:hypothetical protein
MNDIKLLTAFEKKLKIQDDLGFITFDTNMNITYVSNHDFIYGIESDSLDVILRFKIILIKDYNKKFSNKNR